MSLALRLKSLVDAVGADIKQLFQNYTNLANNKVVYLPMLKITIIEPTTSVTVAYTPGMIKVHQAGILLREGDDFTATTGVTLQFNYTLLAGDEIDIERISVENVPGMIAQEQTDWNATTGITSIANKPDFIAAGSTAAAARNIIDVSSRDQSLPEYYLVDAVGAYTAGGTVTLGDQIPGAATGVVWTVGKIIGVTSGGETGAVLSVIAGGTLSSVATSTAKNTASNGGGGSVFARFFRYKYGKTYLYLNTSGGSYLYSDLGSSETTELWHVLTDGSKVSLSSHLDSFGDLANLTTTDKSSFVNAINEIKASPGGGVSEAPSDGKEYVRKNTAWTEHSNPIPSQIVASNYGVKVDARRVLNAVKAANSNILDTVDGNFTAADIGKRVRLYNATTYQHVGTTTIQSVTSSTRVVLADTLATAITAGQKGVCWIGTDNHAALQAVLDTAGVMARATTLPGEFNLPHRLGVVTVSIPPGNDGSGCLVTNTIVVPKGVTLNAGAMIVSDCGNATVDDREWVVEVSAGASIQRLTVDAMWGMGVKFGASSQYSRSHVETVEIWNVGNAYNGTLSLPSHVGAYFAGYDWSIKDLWIKGGNIGLQLDLCSDFIGNNMFLIGCSNALRLENCEQIQIKNMLLDTIDWAGMIINSSSNVSINAQALLNSDGAPLVAMTYGIMLGEYSTTSNRNKNIHIVYAAQCTGGTAVKIQNTADTTIVCNLSNERQLVNTTTFKPITKAIEYGTGNFGYLNTEVNIPTAINSSGDANSIITTSSGTLYGNLKVNGVDVSSTPLITVSTTAPASPTLNQLWLDIS